MQSDKLVDLDFEVVKTFCYQISCTDSSRSVVKVNPELEACCIQLKCNVRTTVDIITRNVNINVFKR